MKRLSQSTIHHIFNNPSAANTLQFRDGISTASQRVIHPIFSLLLAESARPHGYHGRRRIRCRIRALVRPTPRSGKSFDPLDLLISGCSGSERWNILFDYKNQQHANHSKERRRSITFELICDQLIHFETNSVPPSSLFSYFVVRTSSHVPSQ